MRSEEGKWGKQMARLIPDEFVFWRNYNITSTCTTVLVLVSREAGGGLAAGFATVLPPAAIRLAMKKPSIHAKKTATMK